MTDDDVVGLFASLRRWGEAQDSHCDHGVQLICQQPWRGPLAYLHTVYPGLDDTGIAELEDAYGRELPPRLRRLYSAANGLTLFEADLNLDGLVSDFSRDLDAHNPLCPKIAVTCFPGFHPDWHRRGYFPVGSVLGYSLRSTIACDGQDRVIVLSEAGQLLREYQDIFEALTMLIAEMGSYWHPDGRLACSETALDGLLGPSGSA